MLAFLVHALWWMQHYSFCFGLWFLTRILQSESFAPDVEHMFVSNTFVIICLSFFFFIYCESQNYNCMCFSLKLTCAVCWMLTAYSRFSTRESCSGDTCITYSHWVFQLYLGVVVCWFVNRITIKLPDSGHKTWWKDVVKVREEEIQCRCGSIYFSFFNFAKYFHCFPKESIMHLDRELKSMSVWNLLQLHLI